ncbi:ferric reductase-like transmembrane domain-containing protein [Rhodococcus sp. IEGM 1379]|uniref:ferredoxin reductase family protein n=1 Tax=Rhodococcus sp. IEGM 1379 TaxID=3047086 RepID=UPI0024B6C421|nr:ferric reductase-like transmembrane domain-containing protein [Rhodococcus sp. IEGM 1379]MDI9913708.1 ferric reductase-like transmembrane domain-containing protein [Rhodococcus sp. IEGM 1379]
MTLLSRGIAWIGLYLAVTVIPLAFAVLGHSGPGRGFLTEFSVALGFIGLSMMGMQFALVARFQTAAKPFGEDALVQFHREISYVALAFILAHPILLQVAGIDIVGLLNLAQAPWRARFAVTSIVLLLVLIATSIWRRRMKIRYEVWQVMHGAVSVLVVAFALAHVFLVGYYVDEAWKKCLWAIMTCALIFLLLWVRVIRPIMRLRQPWKIESVIPERGDAVTLTMVPIGHSGFRFEPGQFGWLTVDRSPFSVTSHPFSFSSSAENGTAISMTIKSLGDFTSTVGTISPGTPAYLDGPHGVFTPDRNDGPGFVLIAGGVGITPMMSILRTMADRRDSRPYLLFYASNSLDDITFDEELNELKMRVNLTIVHILRSPPTDWTGEQGFLDRDMIARHLPDHHERLQYFVCGPGPMLDAIEDALTVLGVPAPHLHTERFIFV